MPGGDNIIARASIFILNKSSSIFQLMSDQLSAQKNVSPPRSGKPDEKGLAATRPTSSNEDKGKGQLLESIATIVKALPKGTHLTAGEVFRHARELGLKVSLSTIYRTLNQLQAHGNVSTVHGEHGKRYESRNDDEDHDHLICLKCGLTVEFSDDLIRGFGKTLAERKGYEHKHSRFDILGICLTCKAGDEDHKIETAIAALENSIAFAHEAVAAMESGISHLEGRKLARGRESAEAAAARLRIALEELEEQLSFL